MNWLIIYGLVALLASCLYGRFAIDIFSSDPPTHKRAKLAWTLHQIWFNFIGSLAGWAALYPIAIKFERFVVTAEVSEFGIWDAIACFVGIVGITGHLPLAAYSIVSGLAIASSYIRKLFESVFHEG